MVGVVQRVEDRVWRGVMDDTGWRGVTDDWVEGSDG